MTFDDGILTIYRTVNTADPGDKPKIALEEKERFHFGFDTLGIQRYYTAMQAQQMIEAVVNIPGWNDISATDICVLENGCQYKLGMIQPMLDENELRITKLSLERLGEMYAIKAEDHQGYVDEGKQ